ncbi:MAG: CDGSH iron-sulfur domain-containing protein [Candidatus Methanogranum gryphiswaldense]|nr:MAG: CDGSH iron-sulfur domain-containing protein [Candidatus Methanogranum sp. U3.2.1]
MTSPEEPKITVTKNGPYIVSGNVPISEKIITPKGAGYIWTDGRPIPQGEKYSLCRCGHSSNAPFCSGAHARIGFEGTETAGHSDYTDRSKMYLGPALNMLDDDRCAFARFCHRRDGTAWELLRTSDNHNDRSEAIRAASECPAGRLTALGLDGSMMEDDLKKEIFIVQDPTRDVSGGLYVKGGIELVGADGKEYEPRNRYVLCRCGEATIKPFCNAMHVSEGYDDRRR